MARPKKAQRQDGRYAVQVYLGMDDNHKRNYKTVYGTTQKEATEKARIIKDKLGKGMDLQAGRDKFAVWADHWIKTKQTEVSPSRLHTCKTHLDKLVPLYNMRIDKIHMSDIQDIILDLGICNPNTGRPASTDLLRSVKGVAVQIFDLAIHNRVIDYNPAAAVRIPRNMESEHRRALTLEEQSWIINTPHRAQTAAMIMMFAGLRRGELIPLTWNDIDLEQRTISINKTVEMIGGKATIKNTAKTDSSLRTVDIPQILCDYLAAQSKNSILVCVSAKGSLMTSTAWKRMWDSYLNELNYKYGDFSNCVSGKPRSKFTPRGVPFVIPRITAHWLRHTYATMLYFAGVDILTAKDQLGHSDIKTTLEIYTHLDSAHKRRSMSKLDDYLKSEKQAIAK